MAETLRARTSFSYDHKGMPVWVREGELRPANHPDVKGREELFETADKVIDRQGDRATYSAERATAAPGERRQLTHPGES